MGRSVYQTIKDQRSKFLTGIDRDSFRDFNYLMFQRNHIQYTFFFTSIRGFQTIILCNNYTFFIYELFSICLIIFFFFLFDGVTFECKKLSIDRVSRRKKIFNNFNNKVCCLWTARIRLTQWVRFQHDYFRDFNASIDEIFSKGFIGAVIKKKKREK